jgi:hypothetical protein
MSIVPLLVSSSIAIGIGYFCVDLYRNRRRLTADPTAAVNLSASTIADPLEVKDIQATEQVLGEVVHHAGSGIEQGVEAIARTLEHH